MKTTFTRPLFTTAVILICLTFSLNRVYATNKTIATGSFIVNMGIVPQTIGNGLKPYGMIYELLKTYKTPIDWVINTTKAKDGTDFTYNGTNFKGGTFIIEAKYRTAAVNARIVVWQALGVVGVTTTSPVVVPHYLTFFNSPTWTLDEQNGGIATGFFADAGIPASAYGGASSNWKLPSELNCCDDIFVMPHADPKWPTHGHLLEWVSGTGNGSSSGCKGGIWLGCHAGSALMDMFNPAIPSQQTNFLVEKTGVATGAGPWSENALLLWGNHDDGTLPYSYDYSGEPIMQFMGTIDAAQQNGSEQIYIPKSAGWFANTHVGTYDPDHPDRFLPYVDPKHRAATLAYGPGHGVVGNGTVMLESAHDIEGSAPANVAAQRAFFNYSLLVAAEKAILPTITGLTDTINSGVAIPLSATLSGGANPALFTFQWSSTCTGGTFNPANGIGQNVTYTPPAATNPLSCNIFLELKDACNRTTFDSRPVTVVCNLAITKTITNPTCFGSSNGSIAMTITGVGPFTWVWNRTSPTVATGSGSGTTISSLLAGSYSVTVTAASGCTGAFTTNLTQPAQLTATTVSTQVSCFGGTGSINLTASGGTTPYTYNWGGGVLTEDRSGVAAGTYTVTVTDANLCTVSATATITQPAAVVSVTGINTNISCYAGSDGAINITAAGGTSPYTYDWADIAGTTNTEDRTALNVGTYNVTITDANGCSVQQSFTLTQPALLSLSLAVTQPTCPNAPFNGAINLTVTGGTSAYTYSWADLPGSPDPEDRTLLAPGSYSVIVTDANSCTASIGAVLINTSDVPAPPTIVTH